MYGAHTAHIGELAAFEYAVSVPAGVAEASMLLPNAWFQLTPLGASHSRPMRGGTEPGIGGEANSASASCALAARADSSVSQFRSGLLCSRKPQLLANPHRTVVSNIAWQRTDGSGYSES